MSGSAVVENVGVAVGIMFVCCWKLKLHRPAEKCPIFPSRVPLVFQVVPGTGKSDLHAGNVITSGIGRLRNSFWPRFLFAFHYVVIAKQTGLGSLATPTGLRGLNIAFCFKICVLFWIRFKVSAIIFTCSLYATVHIDSFCRYKSKSRIVSSFNHSKSICNTY